MTNHYPCRVRKRGFTLIEMLIVLVIIGILAAIILPVIGRVRESARTTVCASNLKQIGLAMTLYANDHNRHYPAPGGAIMFPGQCGWLKPLEPYVKSTAIFQCPSTVTQEIGTIYYSGQYRDGCPGKVPTDDDEDFVYAGSYDIADLKPHGLQGLRDSDFNMPSTTGYVIDGRGIGVGNGVWTVTTDGVTENHHGILRHNDGANVLFADMHVKWLGHDALDKPGLWSLTGSA